MLISRQGLLVTWLIVISWVFVACSPASVTYDDQTTLKTCDSSPSRMDIESEPTATSSSTPTVYLVAPTPTLLGETAEVMPATLVPDQMTLVKIPQPGEGRVREVRWSTDSQSVIFSTYSANQEEVMKEWWNYVIATGMTHSIEDPFDLSPQIWEELEAARPSNIDPIGTISPSGKRILFARVSPDFASVPDPDEPNLAPIEIWIANWDGSEATRVGGPCPGCQKLDQIVWFDQEAKVLFTCGYEGPSTVFLANTDGSLFSTLGEITGFGAGVGFGNMALSPDGTRLAYTDSNGMLHIVPLDGTGSEAVGFGLMPNWSLDSRRLYYLQGQEYLSGPIGGIHVYDLDTRVDSEVLLSPIQSPGGDDVTILKGQFVIAPSENAAVFQSRGLWLVIWSP